MNWSLIAQYATNIETKFVGEKQNWGAWLHNLLNSGPDFKLFIRKELTE